MSESERKRRLEYRRRRKNLIILQIVIAILVGVMTVVSSILYFNTNSSYEVSYLEQSSINYKVWLKPNDEYEEDYLGEGQSYIASLIDHVDITFNYFIDLHTEWANYKGSYFLDAKLNIIDDTNKKVIFTQTYPIHTTTTFENYGAHKLLIADNVTIGYDEYNDIATNFKEVYGLSDVTCYLDVVMSISTEGECEAFKNNDFGTSTFSLNIPLAKKTIEINSTSNISNNNQSIITCENCNKDLFKNIAIVGIILEVIVLLILVIFAYTTRNHDIVYEIKIKRLVSAYKPYVQKILNEFNREGYRVLEIETFNEMLDIRDTINSPILMSENTDKTCTTFLIPSEDILYVHEIKVEDYDEIYGIKNDIVEEVSVTEDTVKTENVEELSENDFRNGPRYNYSFLAKLHLSSEHTRDYYEEISSFIQSYGLKVNRSWNKERVQLGRKTYAILSFKGLKLTVSFALNPNDYLDTKYKLLDVSETKKFAQTPAQMKVTSLRKVNWVKELFNDMLTKDGVENKNLTVKVSKIKAKTKNKLIKENLIKVQE